MPNGLPLSHHGLQEHQLLDLNINEEEKIKFIYRYIADTFKYNQRLSESNPTNDNIFLTSFDDGSDEYEYESDEYEDEYEDEYDECKNHKEDETYENEACGNLLRVKSRLLTKRASNEYLAVKNSTSSPHSSTVNQLERLSISDAPCTNRKTSPELPYLETCTKPSDGDQVTTRSKALRKQHSDVLPKLYHSKSGRMSVSDETKRLMERSRSVDKILEYTRASSSFSRAESPLVNNGTLPQRKTSCSAPDNCTTERLCSHKIQQSRRRSTSRKISKDLVRRLSKQFDRRISRELINAIENEFSREVSELGDNADQQHKLAEYHSVSDVEERRETPRTSDYFQTHDTNDAIEIHSETTQEDTLTPRTSDTKDIQRQPKIRSRKLGTAGIGKMNVKNSNMNNRGLQPLPPTTLKKNNSGKYTRKIITQNKTAKGVEPRTRKLVRRKKKSSNTNTPKVTIRHESHLVVK